MSKKSREREFDWGDGHKVKVRIPDLNQMEKTTCPVDCYPEGVEGTGKVEVARPKEEQN